MAMIKAINTGFGLPLEYWIIPSVQIDYYAKSAYIPIYGFVNKEQRESLPDNNARPLATTSVNIYPTEFDSVFVDTEEKDLRKIGYAYVMEKCKEFEGAVSDEPN